MLMKPVRMWAITRKGEFFWGPCRYKPIPEDGEKRVRVELREIKPKRRGRTTQPHEKKIRHAL